VNPDLHAWANNLSQLHLEIWLRLARGVHDRHAPARHPTLATVTQDGKPQARTVVLRAVNTLAGTLDIHTDLRSSKVQQLQATPYAAVHVWDASAHLQLRLDVGVTVLTGIDVAAIWAAVPEGSKLSYGSTPAPGQSIAQALAYTNTPDAKHFAVLRLSVQTIDALHLGANHRRARFDRLDDWAGEWLAP